MPDNDYPIARQNQIDLMRECMEDAREMTSDFRDTLLLACHYFDYRIQILSNRVVDDSLLDLDTDIPLLDEDES